MLNGRGLKWKETMFGKKESEEEREVMVYKWYKIYLGGNIGCV